MTMPTGDFLRLILWIVANLIILGIFLFLKRLYHKEKRIRERNLYDFTIATTASVISIERGSQIGDPLLSAVASSRERIAE